MADPRVLIVGAGLAGLAAAVGLARAGFASLVVDQARAPGGAIHRQPLPGFAAHGLPAQRRRWQNLRAEVTAEGDRIEILCNHRFAGIDADGVALLTGERSRFIRPAAVILATGATERVVPVPGWTLPGVTTVGAIQTQLKTSGEPPAGRVLLAGSGPLLCAAAAELAAAGNPPVAIVEAGRPFRHVADALALPAGYLAEASAHLARLLLARVPIRCGMHLSRIERRGDALVARAEGGGRHLDFAVDRIGLHDGIRPNGYGAAGTTVPVALAGDAREALGARAALADGRRAGAALAARLAGRPVPPDMSPALERERAAQQRLRRIHAHDLGARLAAIGDDTVLCRCENRTAGDLRALGRDPTDRELRLRGRFAMGRCQGRFCGEWVRRLQGEDPADAPLGAVRLPVRPLPLADLIDAGEPDEKI
jgi:NADPH-dependent 2,4-dienoyl-CoA reductase/sulfur reductase-like enzyme